MRRFVFYFYVLMLAGCGGSIERSYSVADGVDMELGDSIVVNVLANDELAGEAQLTSVEVVDGLEIELDSSGEVSGELTLRSTASEPGQYALAYEGTDSRGEFAGQLLVRTMTPRSFTREIVVSSPELDEREAELDQREADLDGREAELDEREAELDKEDKASFELSQTEVAFAQSVVGDNGQSVELTVTNTGTVDLVLAHDVEAPFVSSLETACNELDAGAPACTFRVSIAASATGDFRDASLIVAVGADVDEVLVLQGSVEQAEDVLRADLQLVVSSNRLTRDTPSATVTVTKSGGEDLAAVIAVSEGSEDIAIDESGCADGFSTEPVCSFVVGLTDAAIDGFERGSFTFEVTADGLTKAVVFSYEVDRRPSVSFDPSSLNFTDNFEQSVVITNDGETELGALMEWQGSGDGTTGPWRLTLDPRDCDFAETPTCTVGVLLDPFPGLGTDPVNIPLVFDDGFQTSIRVTFVA